MYRWIGIKRNGTRVTGEERTEIAAREAALRAADDREIYVYDEQGRLVSWCSIDAYAGDGAQG